MSISEIEIRRAEARIDQKILCAHAGVNASTYSQLKKGRRGAYARTLEKLKSALDELAPQGEQGHG